MNKTQKAHLAANSKPINTVSAKPKSTIRKQTTVGQSNNSVLVLAELQNSPLPDDYESANGPLLFTLKNDALFHIVFEANPMSLKALICSLLRLKPEEITLLEVTNPIELGQSVYSKSFILDLKLLLNGETLINLEMQVLHLAFWKERSIGYLCRSFDNLNKGDSYADTKPAIHIGILDFDISPEAPEFYASYHLSNDITHKKYSDKFRLSVLQLNHSNLATDEDKAYHLDVWAELFKATTWEEIKMLAEQNPVIAETAKTIYRVSEDERIRQICEAREEAEKTQRTIEILHQRELEEARQEAEKTQRTIEILHQRELEEARQEAEKTQRTIEILHQRELEEALSAQEAAAETIRQQNDQIRQMAEELARLRAEVDSLKK